MITPTGTELLDDPGADPAAVRTSLTNIARANRYFGGSAAARYGVARLLEGSRRVQLSLLDVGTGAGDIPRALHPWAGGQGITLRTFGLERLRPAARLAADPGLPIALGCATHLPFRTGSLDLVILSQVLHHFDRAGAITILREAVRVARIGIVVADLLRSRTAAALFGLGARMLRFDAHTRADGVTSVARGYRVGELTDLFAAAGVEACATTRPWWRVVAWGRPS